MAKKIMTDKHKLACFLLYYEFGRTQIQIATLFEVTQPTVALALKDARFMVEIKNMRRELDEVRQELAEKGLTTPPQLFPGEDS